MKILLATNGTPSSDRAIARVADLTPDSPREVILVHVRPHPPEQVMTPVEGGLALVPAPEEPDMEAHLAYACTRLAARGLDARALLVRGADPKRRILELAEQEDVDLIVVGTRHLGAPGRFLLGSVSAGLATQTRFPLLIVP